MRSFRGFGTIGIYSLGLINTRSNYGLNRSVLVLRCRVFEVRTLQTHRQMSILSVWQLCGRSSPCPLALLKSVYSGTHNRTENIESTCKIIPYNSDEGLLSRILIITLSLEKWVYAG